MTTLPLRYSAAIAGAYLVVGAIYIRFSGAFVARFATSIEHLRSLELAKGFGFIAVTAIVVFLYSRFLFTRLADHALALARYQESYRVLDRRALAGALAAAVAHDSNNELTIAKVNAEVLRASITGGPARESLKDIEDAVDRLTEMMRRLRDLGVHARASTPTELDLVAAVRKTVGRVRAHHHVRDCSVQITGDGPITIRGHGVLLDELIMNLVLNAAEATGGRGNVAIAVRASAEGAALEVSDDGPGVPDQLRDRIFEPFFTTKDEGTGLGLLSVRACAEEHGGRVQVDRSPLGGARFTVWLPGAPA